MKKPYGVVTLIAVLIGAILLLHTLKGAAAPPPTGIKNVVLVHGAFADGSGCTSAEPYVRRLKTDKYADFQMLPSETEDQVVFLGGKDYLPLFCNLTARIRSTPVAFYNSANPPRAKRCHLKRFETTTRTNWHYECANAVIGGSITV